MSGASSADDPLPTRIPALRPRGKGHQFVFYGDACSGVPGAPHEATFAGINAVVQRLTPQPEFIVFPGDEVIGLTADENALRAQWRHWLDVELAWLDRDATPLYHATSNHTTYDRMSERVFADMLGHLPRNGPEQQQGLSYYVRRDDLLLVFVHTCWSGLGGEGHVETDWLDDVLSRHAEVRTKLVVGHHPVFPVNGFSGPYQRQIGPEHAEAFWQTLVRHRVMAYLCSHILAFDVQVRDGVLQLLSAGAGTAHRMPEGAEYLHCVQAAIDRDGLRYQVLDAKGQVRERLSWPPRLPSHAGWRPLPAGTHAAPVLGRLEARDESPPMLVWRFSGRTDTTNGGPAQTWLSAWNEGPALAPLWIGQTGPSRRVTVSLAPWPGRSPHSWFGPELAAGEPFDLQIALHGEMGPGGILWRRNDASPWTSFDGASAWGVEQLDLPDRWSVGHGKGGAEDCPFLGSDLCAAILALPER